MGACPARPVSLGRSTFCSRERKYRIWSSPLEERYPFTSKENSSYLPEGTDPGSHQQRVVDVQERKNAQGGLRRQRQLFHLRRVPTVLPRAPLSGDLREAIQPPMSREAREVPPNPNPGARRSSTLPLSQALSSEALPLEIGVQSRPYPRRNWLEYYGRGLQRLRADEPHASQEEVMSFKSLNKSSDHLS